jgi:excisionase family DNA binding protein
MTTAVMGTPPFNEDRMTRQEAADYLGVSYGTLSHWASKGINNLPYRKIGLRTYYLRSELDQWLEDQKRTQTPF